MFSSWSLPIRRCVTSAKALGRNIDKFSNCFDYVEAVLETEKGKIDWNSLSDNIVGSLPARADKPQLLMPHNANLFVLSVCAKVGNTSASLDLLEHLSANNTGSDVSAVIYRAVLGVCATGKTDDNEAVIRLSDKILADDKFAVIWEDAYAALSNTTDWQRAFDLGSKLDSVAIATMVNVAKRSISSGNLDYFWRVVALPNFQLDGLDYRQKLSPAVSAMHDKVFSFFLRHVDDPDSLEWFFEFLGSSLYVTSDAVAKAFVDKFSVKVRRANLSSNGRCSSCRKLVTKPTETTAEDCDRLYYELRGSNIFRSGDIYQSTYPRELKNFENILETSGKFDIVVDGLNVALSLHKFDKPDAKQIMSKSLYAIVNEIKKKFDKVLLIHRYNIKKYPHYEELQRICSIITLNFVSHDDVFTILAALKSGPGTWICTNDLFRQHSCILKDKETKSLFMRWQLEHQIKHSVAKNKIYFPPRVPLSATKTGDFWHFPLEEDKTRQDIRPKSMNLSTDWLCLKT